MTRTSREPKLASTRMKTNKYEDIADFMALLLIGDIAAANRQRDLLPTDFLDAFDQSCKEAMTPIEP